MSDFLCVTRGVSPHFRNVSTLLVELLCLFGTDVGMPRCGCLCRTSMTAATNSNAVFRPNVPNVAFFYGDKKLTSPALSFFLIYGGFCLLAGCSYRALRRPSILISVHSCCVRVQG